MRPRRLELPREKLPPAPQAGASAIPPWPLNQLFHYTFEVVFCQRYEAKLIHLYFFSNVAKKKKNEQIFLLGDWTIFSSNWNNGWPSRISLGWALFRPEKPGLSGFDFTAVHFPSQVGNNNCLFYPDKPNAILLLPYGRKEPSGIRPNQPARKLEADKRNEIGIHNICNLEKKLSLCVRRQLLEKSNNSKSGKLETLTYQHF